MYLCATFGCSAPGLQKDDVALHDSLSERSYPSSPFLPLRPLTVREQQLSGLPVLTNTTACMSRPRPRQRYIILLTSY